MCVFVLCMTARVVELNFKNQCHLTFDGLDLVSKDFKKGSEQGVLGY